MEAATEPLRDNKPPIQATQQSRSVIVELIQH